MLRRVAAPLAVALTSTCLGVVASAPARSTVVPAGPDLVVEPALPVLPPLVAGPVARSSTSTEDVPLDVLTLHSSPGSRRTIFIDVDGAEVRGTLWNDMGVVGDAPAWDPAGDGPALSVRERATVQEVWARVAEDFAPFDVDVTTEDPGPGAIDRDGLDDEVFGVHVVVSPDDQARGIIRNCWGRCSGVALQGAFDLAVDHAAHQPVWVFPQALGPDVAKFVAEGVSHEVGHTFGLVHDLAPGSTAYETGHAPWAPIMGASHLQPITQWSDGSYAGAGPVQDQIATIAAHGAPLRVDEGRELPVPGATAYITSDDDVDTYDLRRCGGQLDVRASVAELGADLDLALELRDAQGHLVVRADPLAARTTSYAASGLDASLAVGLPTRLADLTLAVSGVGLRGTDATTGYDGYGSVGAYRLSVSGCDLRGEPPGPTGRPTLTLHGSTARISWRPTVSARAAATAYEVLLDGRPVLRTRSSYAVVRGLRPATTHRIEVAGVNANGVGPLRGRTVTMPAVRPSAPSITETEDGEPGGVVSVHVSWSPPRSTGGSLLREYQLKIFELDRRGRVVEVRTPKPVDADFTGATVVMSAAGVYRYAVRARSLVGWSRWSRWSRTVVAR